MKKAARGPICAAGLIIIGALVLLGRTLWAVEQGGYHPYRVASVIIELFFLMLNAGVYMSIFWGSHSRRLFQTLFLWMLALISVGMLGDVFAWGIGLESFPWYGWAHSLGSFLRDAMGFPMLVVYSIYLLSYVKEDAEELVGYGWLVSGLCLDGLLLVIINQITSRSDHQYWNLWDWPWVFFFFLALPICVNIGIIYSFRKMLTNRKAITFIFYELLVIGIDIYRCNKKHRDRYCDVTLYVGEKSKKVRGLYDTGNHLSDQWSGLPVSVADEAVIQKMLDRPCGEIEELRPHYIPYRAIGTSQGVLLAVTIDGMDIDMNERTYHISKPVLALAKESVSFTQHYQLILNPNLIDS